MRRAWLAQAVVEEFCREGGEGEELQALLEQRAKSERNWMEEWWEQLAYLRSRTTMAIHINWFGLMPDFGVTLSNVQVRLHPSDISSGVLITNVPWCHAGRGPSHRCDPSSEGEH